MTRHKNLIIGGAAALVFIAGALTVLSLQHALAPPAGSQTVTAYRDWRLTCVTSREAPSGCALTQDVVAKESGQTIVRLSMGSGSAAGKLVVIVPHDVLLQPGLGLSIGKGKVLAERFEMCDRVGCMALVPIDGAAEDAIADNDGGQVVFLGLDNKPISLPYSLRGFTEGRTAFKRAVAKQNSWWGFLVQ